MPDYKTILYAVDEFVAAITLNRPDKLNALTVEMYGEIADAVETARDDEHVRVVLVTGAGRGFCAGQDLSVFATAPPPDEVEQALMTITKPLIESIVGVEKPTLAAVNGVAAGAGASLALACDLRIMSEEASLLQAFVNIGLVPDAGSAWFLVRLVGYSRAFEMAIEGERIPAERCLELGLANRVVSADKLMDEAGTWAKKLAQRPTLTVGLTKRVMLDAITSDLSGTLVLEAALQKIAVASEDHREGVMAFIEKRKPVFKGK